ncbi:allantoinase [Pterulicium gracile]|uniref:allantoinase n=1 Tax=Pterulicium gracile TaxID=1884261 RepID=A0A5C3QCZ8_9AGAR|nr:allantoinase [Pterula gracilis]
MASPSSPSFIVLKSENVVLSGNDYPQPATLIIDAHTGKITDVHLALTSPDLGSHDYTVLDYGDKYILPGIVDAHVHLNEPGRTEWEGFYTGTRAAASGGVTTLIDMPLNSIPPTTTVENLSVKREAAGGQCWTDVGFWGGVVPGNEDHLRPLVEAGVKGFKCFLIDSGVEEFPHVTEDDLVAAVEKLKCICATVGDPTLYTTFLASRPPTLELSAISLIISLATQNPQMRFHIVHLSTASALPLIRTAKAAGLTNLTVETCFHYLCLASDHIPRGRPEFKCCPPIRDERNREGLWEGLREGLIDFVVSDHSPCVVEMKRVESGDVMGAWGGIGTLGLGGSLLWTEGRKRELVKDLVRWCCGATARHAGLEGVKGSLEVGCDADWVVWDGEAEIKVSKESLLFKNKLSPYEGMTLQGRVEKTFVRGRQVYDWREGHCVGAPGMLL